MIYIIEWIIRIIFLVLLLIIWVPSIVLKAFIFLKIDLDPFNFLEDVPQTRFGVWYRHYPTRFHWVLGITKDIDETKNRET